MNCYNAKYGVELCGVPDQLYSVILRGDDRVFILCSNCVARWVTFGPNVIAFEKYEAVDFK